ncbi:hypothetical protein K503DRAFT_238566 [Rhizopogon vinicolor AM-OR11-026]|uniref:Uncharacterized protein n=1 Tax=Rhizopogon vinicolor AM-OR11-026 TaxID=1314800 RepID=A0A1B7MXS6_9AGAM|nr:hypothetical protein K503DRAFT_238566 [Rhizopogon vinicolor AM-OR11-026]
MVVTDIHHVRHGQPSALELSQQVQRQWENVSYTFWVAQQNKRRRETVRPCAPNLTVTSASHPWALQDDIEQSESSFTETHLDHINMAKLEM